MIDALSRCQPFCLLPRRIFFFCLNYPFFSKLMRSFSQHRNVHLYWSKNSLRRGWGCVVIIQKKSVNLNFSAVHSGKKIKFLEFFWMITTQPQPILKLFLLYCNWQLLHTLHTNLTKAGKRVDPEMVWHSCYFSKYVSY